ncbi:hypothetical protein ACFLYH_02735 [Candidatus Dependentiae bacterium]
MITETQNVKNTSIAENTKNYNEVVEYLNQRNRIDYNKNVIPRMKKLDKLCGNISKKIDLIVVGGANGKSLTMHFASKLLEEEGFKVGSCHSSNILNYNEQISVNFNTISNKEFTEFANKVINIVEQNNLEATAFEILIETSLLYFESKQIKIALLEVGVGGQYDAANFGNPIISAVTRIAHDHNEILGESLDDITSHMLEIARPNNWFISAEQSKLRLQKMKVWIKNERKAKWAMPIRKLASLPYIFEQLFGRTASLGERIAQIYIEDIKGKFSPFLKGNLLATKKGQRGRPTLEAKRQSELNPIKTLKTFWLDRFDLLKGRFELLEKEKPSILLDSAHNVDSFANLFLGIRLLHYQRPLKGLALILSLDDSIDYVETLKQIRYLVKKVPGQILFVPPKNKESKNIAVAIEKAKEMNIKAKSFNSLTQAFEAAKTIAHERDGLICISGSNKIITQYWKNIRGIKVLSA